MQSKNIINIHTKGIKIIVTGPSEVKKEFVNYCIDKAKNLAEYITLIEGVDLGGQDGIYMSLKSPNFKNFLQKSELTKAILFTEEAINRISRGNKKVCFAFNDTLQASKMGSINVVMISSKIFEGRNEDDVIKLLNNIEKFNGRTFLLDSSTEIGKQIDSLGVPEGSGDLPVLELLKVSKADLRYFEFKDAHSNKFWEISVAGSIVTVRYGKLGTNGQTSVKELKNIMKF